MWAVIPAEFLLEFVFTEMCSKNNPLNCWEPVKPILPQYKDEMLMYEGCESRKKRLDDARLKPKHCNNRQSAAKPRTEEGSTTILL